MLLRSLDLLDANITGFRRMFDRQSFFCNLAGMQRIERYKFHKTIQIHHESLYSKNLMLNLSVSLEIA